MGQIMSTQTSFAFTRQSGTQNKSSKNFVNDGFVLEWKLSNVLEFSWYSRLSECYSWCKMRFTTDQVIEMNMWLLERTNYLSDQAQHSKTKISRLL
jgi:hypothetical protein